MEISIREIDKDNDKDYRQFDDSFLVTSKLVLRAERGRIFYTVVEAPPYTKKYGGRRVTDFMAYDSDPDKNLFFAYADNEIAGQIEVQKHWNNYGYICDLGVDSKYRRRGIGRALMARAIEWVRAKGLPGVFLETQDINVNACLLYESCGFELRGFDMELYKALNPPLDEVALYWYLIF
ncbi:MAG: GNAT family N-acetyltransferase [Anaerolineales bacterium]|nr:GNAT family N-acetyltransferase [Anaerolineales bacterium]